jgi:DNA polymerase III alpha subunit (gram-positive type)
MDLDWKVMRELIFVDTETGGLNVETDPLVELTWATRESDPQTLYFGVTEVPEFIDNLIGFTKRGISGRLSTQPEFQRFLEASDGATMVAANPAFDMGFIQAAGLWRFHYRMLDVEAYAMAKLNLEGVPGIKTIFDILKADGADWITEPDHTSRNDVLAMRDAFLILEKL